MVQTAKVVSDDLVKAMKRAVNVQEQNCASCCLYSLVTISHFVAGRFSRVSALSLLRN